MGLEYADLQRNSISPRPQSSSQEPLGVILPPSGECLGPAPGRVLSEPWKTVLSGGFWLSPSNGLIWIVPGAEQEAEDAGRWSPSDPGAVGVQARGCLPSLTESMFSVPQMPEWVMCSETHSGKLHSVISGLAAVSIFPY